MLQEAGYGITEQAFGGSKARYAADSSLLVKFFKHPQLNDARTAEEGRPIYEEVDYIQIMQPGNKDSIIIRPATPMDKSRFSEHFSRYTARMDEEYVEGTLLREWPGITRAQAEELAFFNIKTVEQLANVSDVNAQPIMGINMLREKARAYLEVAEKEAVAEELLAANARINRLETMLAELQESKAAEEAEED